MPPTSPLDQPYDLQALPRTLWLPALAERRPAANPWARRTARLRTLQRWRDALAGGELPPADADFGCPDATAALRQACRRAGPACAVPRPPAMAEQLLRTLLWHLDRLIDLQPG
jgi:hypothetical protein